MAPVVAGASCSRKRRLEAAATSDALAPFGSSPLASLNAQLAIHFGEHVGIANQFWHQQREGKHTSSTARRTRNGTGLCGSSRSRAAAACASS